MIGVQRTREGTFRVAIRDGRKVIPLGTYGTEEQAAAVAEAGFARRAAGLPVKLPRPVLTIEEQIRASFSYEPETGVITRTASRIPRRIGQTNWPIGNHGYYQVNFRNKPYLAHRIVWLLVHGRWPTAIDHANRNKLDNRLCNLRECTIVENLANSSVRSDNKTGLKGARLRCDKNRTKRFFATINIDGKQHRLGDFMTAEEAHQAYCKAARDHYGDFACPG